MKNRSGEFIMNLSGELAYSSFKPSPLPPVPPFNVDNTLMNDLVSAHKKISYLNGIASQIPDMNLFVYMYIRKEALLSSQIEGTQCTLEDVLDPTKGENANKEIGDVLNYVSATEYALKRLNELPLCSRLLKETHKILLSGIRGEEKNPGEFRTSQNWIGGVGCSLKNARYVPPNVDDMKEALSDLEKFMNYDESLDPLIQIALIHYQFETIHPFLDGNGRIGRLLIVLFLIEKKILSVPSLYVSYFLKANRVEYYDRMTQVRKSGDYEQWVSFFLKALGDSCDDATETILKLSSLHNKNTKLINESFLSRQLPTILRIFNYLEKSPIVDVKKTSNSLDLSYNTVNVALESLKRIGIVESDPDVARGRKFVYSEYLNILRKDT